MTTYYDHQKKKTVTSCPENTGYHSLSVKVDQGFP